MTNSTLIDERRNVKNANRSSLSTSVLAAGYEHVPWNVVRVIRSELDVMENEIERNFYGSIK